MFYQCTRCDRRYELDEVIWRCRCGHPLELVGRGGFAASQIDDSEAGLWRYAEALPRIQPDARLDLGERMTPLVHMNLRDLPVRVKMDFLLPTGSYKDRGSCILISLLKGLGVERVADDSSGNAGASIAAYAAAADIECSIYLPTGNSPAKLAQVSAYGAKLVQVGGGRAAASARVRELPRDIFYASHNWHPAFGAGTATMGFEIWEQLGHRCPTAIVAPAGNGSIILGCFRAFEMLRLSGAVQQLPRLYAAQSEAFPSVADSLDKGMDEPLPARRGETIAEGIACEIPVRGREVLRAIRLSHGDALKVADQEIVDAISRLGYAGFFVEPTAAVGAAGYLKLVDRGILNPDEPNVVVLTGTGLKTAAEC